MATFTVHYATESTPAEYNTNQPIPCHTCGAIWDEEEDLDVNYEQVDGDAYCSDAHTPHTKSCAQAARLALYRKEVARQVGAHLREALDLLDDLDREYQGAGEDDNSPYEMIEDAAKRIERFGKGEGTGWNDGLMLDWMEARKLNHALQNVISNRVISAQVRVKMIAESIRPNLFHAFNDGEIIGTLGQQLLMLTAAQQRTDGGAR